MFESFGDDGKQLIEKYGDDLIDVINGLPETEKKEALELINSYGDNVINVIKSNRTVRGIESICEEGCESAQGLIGTDFEDYLVKIMNGEKSFSVEGREFDGRVGNRWWEAKSGKYWERLENNIREFDKFKSDMGNRLDIAIRNGATYELFLNTPIPKIVKEWLMKKGIVYTELLY